MEWDKIWAYNKKIIDPIVPRYTALAADRLVKLKLEQLNEDGSRASVTTERKLVAAHPKVSSPLSSSILCSAQLYLHSTRLRIHARANTRAHFLCTQC